MKKAFVKTKNVKKFVALMSELQELPPNIPKIALVFGDYGLGKSETIKWWTFKNECIYIRANQGMTTRWLLSEIADELNIQSYWHINETFKEIESALLNNRQTIIIDEIDYLTVDSRAVETLRDIHDKTNVPIILVGMTSANSRLKKFNHLYDRLSEIVKFEKFSKADIKTIVQELSEIEMTECAIRYMYSNLNRFRQIVKVINKAEMLAKANGLNSIDEILIKEAITNETEDAKTDQNT